MSGRDHTDAARSMQENSSSPPNVEVIQLRLAVGVVSRADLTVIFGVSPNTIKRWVAKGLKQFRPGTREYLFDLAEVREFLSRRETFAGVSRTKKKPRK